MALLFANGTNCESTVGSTAMHVSANTSASVAGAISAGCTAPNLVNQATGVIIFQNSTPNSSAIYTIELRESGVTKATATINGTDLTVGFQYVRFATPYTFATLTANAYTIRITSTLNSGTFANATSGFWYEITYDNIVAPTVGDDIIGCGWHNAGLTAKTWTVTGTTLSFGSGVGKALGSSLTRTMQAGLMISNGFTFKMDDTADCTVQLRGSVFVWSNGLFDKRANTSDIEIVSKFIFDCETANGNYGFHLPPSNTNGRILMDGMDVSRRAQYVSGVGTAANPIVTTLAHNLKVNDELIIPGTTYDGNQIRYVISIPGSNQLVVSSTLGGSENAITNTPVSGSWIGNLTSNSIVSVVTPAFGYYLYNNSTNDQVSSFDHVRWEYASCASGPNLQFIASNAPSPASIDGMVGYLNSAAGRTSWSISGTVAQEINDCILFETLGSNYVGQSGMALSGASNKTINRLMTYAKPSPTVCCAGLSLTSSATNNTINDSHCYGATANNGTLAYAFGLTIAHNNTFNDCTINNSRIRAIYATDGFSNTFNNCNFTNNNTDFFMASNSLGTTLFNDCNFNSTNLTGNIENTLPGTDVAFQNMDGNETKHRWLTPFSEFWSSGPGLTDTTVRTPGSLALAIKPRNDIDGTKTFLLKIPAPPTSRIVFNGYLYRNSTYSSGEIKVQLFLPGSNVDGTPDDEQTMPTTTEEWMSFEVDAFNPSTVSRYATIRILCKTATPGAVAFLDDIYDAGLLNKVAGLDLWDAGHISPIMVVTDFSSAVPVLASASAYEVWETPDSPTTADTMGERQAHLDADISTRATPAQVNTETTNALNTYDPPTKSELDTAIDSIPTATQNAQAVETEIGSELDEILSNTDATQAKIDQL